MTVVSDREIEKRFGISGQQLEEWDQGAAAGEVPGEPAGEVVMGRPLLFGQKMRQVGFKEPLSKVEAIDKRAAQLGMRRSEYLRHLVDKDLKRAGLA